jgi:beta-mannanase
VVAPAVGAAPTRTDRLRHLFDFARPGPGNARGVERSVRLHRAFGFTVANDRAAKTAQIGAKPAIVMWYAGFNEAGPDLAGMADVADSGATPMITWEPWRSAAGMSQTEFSLQKIAAGQLDSYVVSWARAIKSWGRPVDLRFAQEPNGSWFPWCVGVNDNTAADYVAAWRHIHDVFAGQGVQNLSWVWSPNQYNKYSTTLAQLTAMYPGSSYVEVVGVDAYNWGTTESWSTWQSPAAVLGGSLALLRTIAPGKPLMIAETASVEAGGDKAAWIRSLYTYVTSQRDVIGVIWFDENTTRDWRFNSSPAAAAAMSDALAH